MQKEREEAMPEEEEITPEELARIKEEEFGVSPEEQARIDAKLSAILTDLRAGRLPLNRLPGAIHEFGEEHFDEALPEIVASLTNPEETVRYMALHVLTFHFQLKDYKPAAIEMLLHDPDEDCRRQAAAGLGSLMKNTVDREALHVLAQVVHNEDETEAVRASAYRSMYTIVNYDRQQQHQLIETLFEPGFTFDWEFVDQYM